MRNIHTHIYVFIYRHTHTYIYMNYLLLEDDIGDKILTSTFFSVIFKN